MLSAVDISPQGSVLYAPQIVSASPRDWFDPDWLRRHGLLRGSAPGRGTTWFFAAENQSLVLRHYRRGGLVARLLHDSYCAVPLARTRAWREWHLLAWLRDQGLPVPQPVAARVIYRGPVYRCDLITVRIADARAMADRLLDASLQAVHWEAVGRTIRHFHDRDVFHADLNARNVLFDGADAVHLIDFDRGRRRAAGTWREANLRRLHRSLTKLAAQSADAAFDAAAWTRLREAYASPQP